MRTVLSTSTILKRSRHLTVIYFLAVGILYVFAIPIGQAPDESAHLAYINFITTRGQLTNQNVPDLFVDYEGNQPPLYYMLGALLLKVVNAGEPCRLEGHQPNTNLQFRLGPHAFQGWMHWDIQFVGFRDGATFYLLRLFSVLCGAGIVLFTLRISALFFADSLFQVVPALFIATLPQFLFNSAYINNDVLNNLFTTGAIYWGLRMVTQARPVTSAIWLGAYTGLSLCTKKSGLFLCPCIFALICWKAVSQRATWAHWVQLGLATFGIAAAVSSWVLVRNRLLYGEWFGTRLERLTFPWQIEQRTLLSSYFRGQFLRSLYTSFVGRFGWMDVMLPRFVYLLYLLLMGLGGAGLGHYLWKGRRPSKQSSHFERIMVYGSLGCIASCFTGIIIFNLTFTQPQGRYLFAVAPLIGVLLALGWKTLYRELKITTKLTPRRQIVVAVSALILPVAIDFLALQRIHTSS